MKSAEKTSRTQASLPTCVIAADQIGELQQTYDTCASVFCQCCPVSGNPQIKLATGSLVHCFFGL